MLALRLWLRRSTARRVLPAMVVVMLLVVFSRTGWSWERSQAVSWASSSILVLGPIAAGLVAFDLWRGQTATIRLLTATTLRGPRSLGAQVVATWALTVATWLLGVLVALLLAARHGAAGAVPWWIIAQGLTVLLASVCLGAAVGTVLRNVAAPVLATVGCYLLAVGLSVVGVPGVLTAGGATSTLVGTTQDTAVAASSLVATALLGGLAWLVASRLTTPRRRAGIVGLVATSLALGVSLVHLSSLDPMTASLRRSDSAQLCVGSAPEVCGPQEGAAIYRIAAADLSSAGTLLAADGILLPDRYTFGGSGAPSLQPGVGWLTVSTEEISGGHLSAWDVAVSVATPAGCRQVTEEDYPAVVALVEAQGALAGWVVDRLAGTGGAAPTDIEGARETFDALVACDPAALPPWTYG